MITRKPICWQEAAKSFAMKKSLADQVLEFMQSRGGDYRPADLAAEVAVWQAELPEKKRCKRQNIEQLLDPARDIKNPHYLPELAKAMGTTVETLRAGTYSPLDQDEYINLDEVLPPSFFKDHEERKAKEAAAEDLKIVQYDTGGAMGGGLVLEEQPPGHIKAWHVDHEWLRLNVRHHTGVKNLCIVTGFGPSMKPRFNPGDPLLMDRGVTKVDHDGIYFFRVGDQGFIKQLQRIFTENGLVIRVKSFNPDFDPWEIRSGMDFEVFGKILTVWKSEQF